MTRLFFMALLMLGFAGAAHADVISMSEDACRSAEEGAKCEGDTGPGTCQPDRCCRNDYSDGPPPKQVCSDCLTCQPAPATPEKRGCDLDVAGGPFGLGALALGLLLAIGLRRSRR